MHHDGVSQYPEPAPYGASGAYGGGATPRQPRTRPSPWWFAVGGALLVLGLTLAVAAIVLSVAAFTRVEAQVPADGVTRTVRVEPGADYLLWTRPAETQRCDVVDGADRTVLVLQGLGAASYTRDVGSGSWEGAATFTATSPTLEVTCQPASSPVEIGEKPQVHTLVGGIFLGLVLPVLLALVGGAALLVMAILYVVRAPRAR